MFKLWEDEVIFKEGLYAYIDGKGNNSLISHERANEIEEDYQKYQASMDIDRGGMPDRAAYGCRGLNEDGTKLLSYETDNIPASETVKLIKERFVMPEKIGSNIINVVTKRAFLNCSNLYEIVLPESVTVIGDEAFAGCADLKNIIFKGQIIKIGAGAFNDTELYTDLDNWQGEALYINNWLIKVRKSFKGNFEVAENTIGIADNAFENCDEIEEVNMPESVMYIGNYAFEGCSRLKEVRFPKQISAFGINVLRGCVNLKSIKFPEGVTRVNGFKGIETLEKLDLPQSVNAIDRNAFEDCILLKEIHLPDNLERIGDRAFNNTAYANNQSNWKNDILYLDNWLILAEENINSTVIVDEGTVGIADCAFTKDNLLGKGIKALKEIHFPDCVQYIGENAFNGCVNLSKVNIPKSLKCLNEEVFRSCIGLKEIIVPLNVKEMKKWVFYSCTNLRKIVIENPDIKIEWPAFCCKNAVIYSSANSNAEKYAQQYKLSFARKQTKQHFGLINKIIKKHF